MDSRAEFGVVLPTRNRPGALARALSSLCAQNVTDWRAVVVDDASSSSSADRVRDLTATDSRVGLTVLEHHSGAAVARNRAATELATDFLVFMDDDCWWAPDRLARIRLARRRADYEVNLGYTRMVTVAPGGRTTIHGRRGTGPFTGGWRVGTPMMFVRKTLFDDVGGFDEKMPRFQDFDLALRLNLRAESVFIPDAVVWTEETNGISGSREALWDASARLLVKYRGDSRLPKTDWATMHRELAYRMMELGERREAIRHYLRMLWLQPLHPVHWGLLVAAASGHSVFDLSTRLVEACRGVSPARREQDLWSPPNAHRLVSDE